MFSAPAFAEGSVLAEEVNPQTKCDRSSIKAAERGELKRETLSTERDACELIRFAKASAHDAQYLDAAKMASLAMLREPLIKHEARALFVHYAFKTRATRS